LPGTIAAKRHSKAQKEGPMVDTSRIRDDMEVISADGESVGRATGIGADGLGVRSAAGEAWLPLDWIGRIDDHVHLLHGAAVVRGRLGGAPPVRPNPTQGRLKGPFVIGALLLLIAIVLLFVGFGFTPRQ
jgi:hypothetical protein